MMPPSDTQPVRILFVCHGNICRSPMAQYVMEDLAQRRGCADSFIIDSAATSSEEIGNPVHPGTREALRSHSIACGDHRARKVTASDYGRFDLIIGMDAANMRSLMRCFGGDPDGKVQLLLDSTGEHRDVADPWYTGDFETTYRDVYAGCTALLEQMTDRRA